VLVASLSVSPLFCFVICVVAHKCWLRLRVFLLSSESFHFLFRLISIGDELLLAFLSQGYSGVSGNFYPWVHAWLCANWESEPEKAVKVQRFLTVAEALVKTMCVALSSPPPYPRLARSPTRTVVYSALSCKCSVTRIPTRRSSLVDQLAK
jgi:hypothetical protein